MSNKLTVVEERLNGMGYKDLRDMTEMVIQFEEATNFEISQILVVVKNLQNDSHGTSNKVQCASYDLNHWVVISYLKDKGWIDDDNNLTSLGFVNMNNVGAIFDPSIKPVLQNYSGSLYWNTSANGFEKIWEEIVSNCAGKNYNRKLKDTELPLSPQTISLCKKMVEDGTLKIKG